MWKKAAIHHVQLEGSGESGVKMENLPMHHIKRVSPTPTDRQVTAGGKPSYEMSQMPMHSLHQRQVTGGKPQYIIYRGPHQATQPPTVVISQPEAKQPLQSLGPPEARRSTPSPRSAQYRHTAADSPISHVRASPMSRDSPPQSAAAHISPASRDTLYASQMRMSKDSHSGGFLRASPNHMRSSPVPRDSPSSGQLRTSPTPREPPPGNMRVSPADQHMISPVPSRYTPSPSKQLQAAQAQRKSPSPGLLQGILQGNMADLQRVTSSSSHLNSHSSLSSLPSQQKDKPVFTGPIPVPTTFSLPLEPTENPLLIQLQQQQHAALMKLAARSNPDLARQRDREEPRRQQADSVSHSHKARKPPRHIDIPASVSTAVHPEASAGSEAATTSQDPSFKAPAANSESHNTLAQPLTIDTNVITTIAKTIAEMIGLRSPSQLSQTRLRADTNTTHSPTEGMPRLHREISQAQDEKASAAAGAVKQENKDAASSSELETVENPFNMRVSNLSNFPSGQTGYRATYRSQTVAIHRAKAGSITSAAKSLDILRQNLQKYINKEIDAVIQRYVTEFFEPAMSNIRMNNGETSVTSDHLKAVCRQMLEEAKKMYPDDTTRSSTPDMPEHAEVDSTSSNPNGLQENSFVRQNKFRAFNIKRRGSTDSEKSNKSIPRKKKKGRPPLQYGISGRSTPSKTGKTGDVVRREGPMWDPSRLKEDTKFIMGARANKALGLGQTRGRLYIKHPDVFKYSGDQEDKNFLHEHHYMPATGGKAYMLLLDDIKDLCDTDEYRHSPALQLNELVGFTVPTWMLEKMKLQMQAMRTDVKPSKLITASLLNNSNSKDDFADGEPPLPFSSLQDNTHTSKGSPANTETMDLLSAEDQEEELTADVSPFHVIGSGYDASPAPDVSPPPSDLDGIDDEGSFSGFGIND